MQILIPLVIGIFCLYSVVKSFNWSEIRQAIQKVDYLLFFGGSAATLLLYFFLRTLRWHVLLKGENVEIPFAKLYLYNAIAIGLSTITPFQSGEALKVELIRKYGGKRLSGYAIFFLERILDLLTVVGFAIISTALGLDFGINPVYLYALGAFLISGLLLAAAAVFLLPFENFQPLRDWLDQNRKKKKNLGFALILTFFSWSTIILGWQQALFFFGIVIDFLQASAVVTLTTLLVIISFVPGAVGVSELSVSKILSGMGVETSLAQAGAIAVRCYAVVILILTLLHWLFLKLIYKNDVK